jgi:transposase
VVAPSLVPRTAGERIKSDRLDAINLAKLQRADELSPVWVPDPAHEAIRDVVRVRLAAVRSVLQARRQFSGFLLRHGHHYNRPAWTLMHWRWLTGLSFEHAPHYTVLEDCIAAVEAATVRQDRLEAHIEAALSDWSLTSREGAASAARLGAGSRGDAGGGTRRHHPLRESPPVHGLSGSRSFRAFQEAHAAGAGSPRRAMARRGVW